MHYHRIKKIKLKILIIQRVLVSVLFTTLLAVLVKIGKSENKCLEYAKTIYLLVEVPGFSQNLKFF